MLPRFALAFIKSGLKTSIGVVEAEQLLSWTDRTLPSELTAVEIRNVAIKRIRAIRKEEELRDTPIGIALTVDYEAKLTSGYVRVTLEKVLAAIESEEFANLTLKQFKQIVRLPTEACLGLLAKVESAFWTSSALMNPAADPGTPYARALTDTERSEVIRLLNLPWIAALTSDDLRFPATDGVGVRERLAGMDADGDVSVASYALFERLKRASDESWGDELMDVASHAAGTFKSLTTEAKANQAGLFQARYGGMSGRTLEDASAAYGVSGARAWQICRQLVSRLNESKIQMPMLERLFSEAAALCPLGPSDLNHRLSERLGSGVGIEAAVAFAKEIGWAPSLSFDEATIRTDVGSQRVRMVFNVSANAWIQLALTHARRDCLSIGCTTYLRLAGQLALKHEVVVDLSDLTSLMEAAPGYRMLDAESGWFTLQGNDASATALRIRKIMSVATTQVDVDEMAISLVTDDTWLNRESRQSLAIPPTHVLVELIKGWDWLSHNRQNRFWLSAALPAASALSTSEAVMVAAVDSFNGVASRQEIAVFAAHPDYGLSEMIVNKWLACSPVFVRYQTGIYGLRGRPLVPDAINAALDRKVTSASLMSFVPEPDIDHPVKPANTGKIVSTVVYQPHPFKATGNLRMRTLAIRKSVSALLNGAEYFEHTRGEFDKIRVWQGSTVWGIADAAESLGVMAGEPFQIIFDLENMTFDLNVEIGSDF